MAGIEASVQEYLEHLVWWQQTEGGTKLECLQLAPEQLLVEEQVVDQLAVGEQAAEQLAVGGQAAEQRAVGDQAAEQFAVGDQAVEQLAVGDQAVEQLAAQKRTAAIAAQWLFSATAGRQTYDDGGIPLVVYF